MTELERLRRTVAELTRQNDAVRRIAVGLSTRTETDDLVHEALDISLELAKADAGSILLYRPEKEKLVFEYVVGEKSDELTGMETDPSRGISGEVFQSGKTRVIQDANTEKAHSKDIDEKIGYITVNMVSVALKSPQGSPVGVMHVLNKQDGAFDEHDVNLIETMASQIAIAMETTRLNEEARLAAIMRFIGNLSHDVKNMVTPTVTGAETIKLIADDCFASFDQVLDGLERVEAERFSGSMTELRELYPEIVELIIDGCEAVQERMSEISSAVKGIVSKPQFEPTDVGSIARRVGAMLSQHAHRKGVMLAIEPDGELPLAEVDGKQIYNAAYNLILNAIDACARGDSVTFSVGRDGESHFILECADTGPGIPEHVKAVLFTENAVSTKPMGTGLGTKIVKNVIDAHSGTVQVTSELGAGTSIRCRIPVSRTPAGS